MEARQDPASGQIDISESGTLVLRYNYKTVEPGEVLDKVTPANRIYARARSDYIHPLYGLSVHTNPSNAVPRRAWSDLSGVFDGASAPSGLTVLQHRQNADYPGHYYQQPTLSWCQPTFPAAGTRYALRRDQPLVLRYRLFIHAGDKPDEGTVAKWWDAFNGPAAAMPVFHQ